MAKGVGGIGGGDPRSGTGILSRDGGPVFRDTLEDYVLSPIFGIFPFSLPLDPTREHSLLLGLCCRTIAPSDKDGARGRPRRPRRGSAAWDEAEERQWRALIRMVARRAAISLFFAKRGFISVTGDMGSTFEKNLDMAPCSP